MLEWIKKTDVENLSWVAGRNKFADECCDFPVDEILKRYVYLSAKDVAQLIRIVEDFHGDIFKGVGVELGAGVGIFSAIVSQIKSVDKIYALELVPNIVKKIQKRVFKKYGNPAKLVSTLGSFDDIKLKTSSCDFIIEYDSLHHSFDLQKTLNEAYRILKPGGVLIAIDRVQSNMMGDHLKKRLLEYEYSEDWLIENNYDASIRLTREMNGEHEIRENEWIESFEKAGFCSVKVTKMVRPSFKLYLYSVLTMIPDLIKKRTRYSRLSSYPFTKIIPTIFIKNSKKENIGKFVGCLDVISCKSVMVKSLIFAVKN